MLKSAVAVVLAASLVACGVSRPRPVAPRVPGPPAASPQSLPPAGDYRIDSSNSELRLLVYRAGALASLGHNHVMVNRGVTGVVRIADSVSTSSFSFVVPVDDFEIDDSQSRREEGSDFPGDISEEAKLGTRRNMLSAALLNAAAFPLITVKSAALQGSPGELTADVTINIAGHESAVSVPFALGADPHRLTASGSIELRQSDLGLTPYSLMRGALQVQDALRVKFTIAMLID